MKRAIMVVALALFPLLPMAAHAEPRTYVIEISRMAFGTAPAGVYVGDKIVWRNKDMFRHTATAREGAFDLNIAAGAEAQTVLKAAGELEYYCRFHPTMVSTMTVQP